MEGNHKFMAAVVGMVCATILGCFALWKGVADVTFVFTGVLGVITSLGIGYNIANVKEHKIKTNGVTKP